MVQFETLLHILFRYGYKEGVNALGERATSQTATGFGNLRYRFQGVDFKGKVAKLY